MSDEEEYVPVMCLNPAAPDAIMELKKCGCASDCSRQSCLCRKNNLVCCLLCKCGGGDACSNTKSDDMVHEELDEGDLI